MGNRIKGKTKPKSVKAAKSSSMGSKRKLSRFGKNQKKDHSGLDATFLPRARVLKKLQISLKDFRRLCILKGVYPREPRGRAPGNRKGKAYYHLKDVRALAHEPLLAKFREFGSFMKKVRRAAGRNEKDEARRKHDALKPTYTLHHLVRERYPRFRDALADLDDALSLTFLFAALPSQGRVRSRVTTKAKRLAGSWGAYVAATGSVTKSFASVKGVYLEADIPIALGNDTSSNNSSDNNKNGSGEEDTVSVRWVVPHAFTQRMPTDVDFRVMLTFFEFYETLLDFVLFKLYADAGVRYPPPAVAAAAAADPAAAAAGDAGGGGASAVLAAHLAAFDAGLRRAAFETDAGGRTAVASVVKDAAAGGGGDGDAPTDGGAKTTKAAKKKRKKLVDSIGAALKDVREEEKGGGGDNDDDDMDEDEDGKEKVDIAAPLREALRAVHTGKDGGGDNMDDDAPVPDAADGSEGRPYPTLLSKLDDSAKKRKCLFGTYTFFLSREVPRGYLELVILSRGGRVGWECTDDSSPILMNDPSVTHHITDRPSLPTFYREKLPKNREYVQPQYVLDCANFDFVLPVRQYGYAAAAVAAGGSVVEKAAVLPPHLSPWADEDTEGDGGYKPRYAEDIERLKNGEAPMEDDKAEAIGEAAIKRAEEDDESSQSEDEEEDSEVEEKVDTTEKTTMNEEDDEEDDDEEEEEEEEEEDPKETERKAAKRKIEDDEEAHRLARAMMSKKASRLYDRMQHGIAAKQSKVDNLHKKRREIESTREKTKDGKTLRKQKLERLKKERRDIEGAYGDDVVAAHGGSMKKNKESRKKARNI